MKKHWVLLAAMFVVLFFITTVSSYADILIVCNSRVVDTTLSKNDIKDIFLGKKTKWSDKTKVHFATLNDEDVHKLFLKKYIKKTASQYRNYWKQLIFTGKGKAPKKFDSVEKMLKHIAVTDGSIGYISTRSTAILGAFSSSIQTINVK